MAFFNPSTKEITAKIVYYGPGMCGKTTNLQKVHQQMKRDMRGDLVSVATETDRTIYFDYLPLKLGKIAGFDFVTRVFTVPGQTYYAQTRRMVLQGADGVVFVADSQKFMMEQNRESMLDLKKNLKENNLDFDTIPMVIQYNKQDMADLAAIEDMEAAINERKVPYFKGSAITGQGVVETLKYVTLAVFKHVRDKGLTAQRGAPANLKAAKPAEGGPSESMEQEVQRIAEASHHDDKPAMPSKEAIALQEFQNLAVMHHKLVERVAVLEQDMTKLKRDYQDLKLALGKKLMKGPEPGGAPPAPGFPPR